MGGPAPDRSPPEAAAPRGALGLGGRLVPLALAAAVLLTFWPSLDNEFVSWDDAPNLTRNPYYRGLDWAHVRWMLTTFHSGHYAPLTWLSFGLDHAVWGMNPVGYHLTNLLLHVASTLLVYAVARRLLALATGFSDRALTLGAATAALAFAVHPLRAESVAWATDRTDLLSGALFLSTVLLYLRAATGTPARRRWLALSVACYVLALAAKASVVTLPLVLLLLDVYPLGRLAGRASGSPAPVRRILAEKLPYLAVAGMAALAAYLAKEVLIGPTSPNRGYPWPARAATVVYSLWFYPLKTLVPVGLSPLYEAPPRLDVLEARFVASAVGVAAVTVLLLLLRERWPAGLATWTCHAVLLAPVSGIVPIGSALVADRYSYLPGLAFAVLIGAAAGRVAEAATSGTRSWWAAPLAVALALGLLLGLAGLTWRQTRVWHDSESLWRHAVAVAPDCFRCQRLLAEALLERGDGEAALAHFRRAAALRPDAEGFRVFVGLALARLGRWGEAIEEYRAVLAQQPERADLRHAIAVALHALGDKQAAAEELRRAARQDPSSYESHLLLGLVLEELHRDEEAAEHLRRATELRPGSPQGRLELVRLYVRLGRLDLAREQYGTLNRLDPRSAGRIDPRTLGRP